MKPTQFSVTETPCTCGYLQRCADDPDVPIVFDRQLNEYHFEYPSPCAGGSCPGAKAQMMIYHCPLCGGAAPESKRDLMFAVISLEEQRRMHQLLDGIKTVEDAIRVLGAADQDRPKGATISRHEHGEEAPTIESFRMLTYSGLSDTAEVVMTDYPGQGIHYRLQGKYIGPSAPDSEA